MIRAWTLDGKLNCEQAFRCNAMASASQGLRCLFALLLPLVVAVRPGHKRFSGAEETHEHKL
eukprot:5775810-Amphidinium_carterae.1